MVSEPTRMLLETIPAGELKMHCVSLLDEVVKTHETIVVTEYGKPVARVIPSWPSSESHENPLKNSILFEEDLIEPIDVEWGALK